MITDAAGSNSYMHTVQGLVNGTDMYCYMTGTAKDNRIKEINKAVNTEDDGYLVNQLKNIAHNIYYTYAHTNLMNGLTSAYDIVPVTPMWQYLLLGINILLWLIAIVLAVVYALNSKRRKEN